MFVDSIIQSGLPCLVAISKRKGLQGFVKEPIVGFRYLTELADPNGIYRYSFQLATYVHPDYLQQSIGRCLLDQVVFMCNTGYHQRGGYEYRNESEYLKSGHSRTIKTILANYHYERGYGKEAEWMASYLGEYGFKKAGRLSQFGHKAGKVVDKLFFQLQTTEIIDPASIPITSS